MHLVWRFRPECSEGESVTRLTRHEKSQFAGKTPGHRMVHARIPGIPLRPLTQRSRECETLIAEL
ncbi:MAG: hypothetical protein DMG21_08665 [Acidobacteria bacterium]|nr:MAG: hypothetical protein DMG21_08665 [Acidobacteriota bacterium]